MPIKIPTGTFPHRLWTAATKIMELHSKKVEEIADAVGSLDACMAIKPFNGAALAVAVGSVIHHRKPGKRVALVSATKYMDLTKNFSEINAGGFDSVQDILLSEILLITELSYVSATVAAEIDGLIYRRFCANHQTIVSGYNLPVESGFHAETIDGFGGYPLLSSRLDQTVLVFQPELKDECFR